MMKSAELKQPMKYRVMRWVLLLILLIVLIVTIYYRAALHFQRGPFFIGF